MSSSQDELLDSIVDDLARIDEELEKSATQEIEDLPSLPQTVEKENENLENDITEFTSQSPVRSPLPSAPPVLETSATSTSSENPLIRTQDIYEGLGESFLSNNTTVQDLPLPESEEIDTGELLLETPPAAVEATATPDEATEDEEGPSEPFPPEDEEAAATSTRLTAFPISKVKRIMKLDPEITIVSHEAALLVTKATEVFASILAKEVQLCANLNKKKTLKSQDLQAAIQVVDRLSFLDGALEGLL